MNSESTLLSPLPTAAPLSAPARLAGKLLVLLVCALAGLLAATPARNSDLWLHLAAGRSVAAGHLPDGVDPFSSTTRGVYWVNPTWLSDLLLYELYQLGGGPAVIIAKIALVALLAALLFAFRRRGEGGSFLALVNLAAVLALGPWLLLQPLLLSLCGVVLTLYVLERPHLLEGLAATRARTQRWWLVPLFALWANLDGWFLLGPALVGLYAVGSLGTRKEEGGRRKEEEERRNRSSLLSLFLLPPSSFLLFCAGLLACLATPYHYRIFAWPTPLGLTPAEQALQHDPLGRALVLSPFGERFAASPVFRSPGAWAYYVLLAASAVSFVLPGRRLHWGRLLVWLALAALSIYQAHAIPFFVVAAAPLLALNVQEWMREQPYSEARQRLQIAAERLGVLLALTLLVLAWPGWLQLPPYQPRGWTVEPDGSLVRLAQRLRGWHAESCFPADRYALTFSPEVAHHLAWFCPEEKGFLDSRWPLFNNVAEDYVRLRQDLLQEGDAEADATMASVLKAHAIDRVILHDVDAERTARAYRHLFLAAPEWELLAVEGGATLFRRRGTTPALKSFDDGRAAYHPAPDECAPPPPRPPQPPRWYDAFLHRRSDRSPDREEAAIHLLSFDLQAGQQQARLAQQWLLAQMGGLLSCGPATDAAGAASTLAVRLALTPLPISTSTKAAKGPALAEQAAALFLAQHEAGPAEPLLLAVRAARRALGRNPDDAGAFLLLGEAYFRLARQTREAHWKLMLPELAALRQAQMLTALEQAALLRPDFEQAHTLLDQLYYEAGQMDRCLDHRRARLRLAEKDPERRDAESLAALRTGVAELEKLVMQSEKTYQANLAGRTDPSKVLLRAQKAAQNGLARKALQMMLDSYPAIFGKEGVEYELELMVQAGQCYEVRDWLKPEHEFQIDFDVYHGVQVRAAASCGDYAAADAEMERGGARLRQVALSRTLLAPVRSAVALHVARAVLTRPVLAEGVAGLATVLRFQWEALQPLQTPAGLLRQQADRQVLRGLLTLESGEVEKARQHFRAAGDVWGSDRAAATGAGLDFSARPIAQQMLRRLQE